MKKTTRLVFETFVIAFLLGLSVSYVFLAGFISQPNEAVTLEPLPDKVMTASSNIVAVSMQGEQGVLGTVDVEIRDGKGRVLINTNPFVEPDTQFSAETAVSVAQTFTKKSLSDKDVILTFNMPAEVVGGPSAGAAMAVAVIAAIEDKKVNNKIAITGTIENDGNIGQIGGVLEKSQAAAENGMILFLVPDGQSTVTYYEKKIEEQRRGGFVFQRVRYVPKQVDLNNLTAEFGMTVREVSSIEDAVGYMVG